MTPPLKAPHPVGRLAETLARVPRYLTLARALAVDPAIPRWRKAALAAGIIYLASPIDVVPGIIPVAGQLDDLAAALLGLRTALRGATPEARAAHLAAAGLAQDDIARDLAIVRDAAGWLARGTARTVARLGAASAKAAIGTARIAGKGAAGAARLGIAGARRIAATRRRAPEP